MIADWDHQSRTLAMQLTQLAPDGSREDLHFIANSHTDPLDFELPLIGEYEWFRLVGSGQNSPLDTPTTARNFGRSCRRATRCCLKAWQSSWQNEPPVDYWPSRYFCRNNTVV